MKTYRLECIEKLVMGIPYTEFLVYEFEAENRRVVASFFERREAYAYCKWRSSQQKVKESSHSESLNKF